MKETPEIIIDQLKEKEPLKFFFINNDLKHPEEDSLKEKEKIIEWAKGLTPINTKKLEYENLIFKQINIDYMIDNNIINDIKIKKLLKHLNELIRLKKFII